MTIATTTLRVMLLEDPIEDSRALRLALEGAGYEVVVVERTTGHVRSVALQPDVIVLQAASPTPVLLDQVGAITHAFPRPVVMFTDDPNNPSIEAAIKAGVTAYIIAGMQPERVRSIVEVARVRFEHEQTLRDELRDLQHRLTERKVIEKAKGLLMAQKGCSEEDAYRSLRKLAMDRNLRLLDVARQVIDVAKLLN